MLDFSQRLKQLRRDRHLTQAQVAKRIGVTAAMVSSYETDIRLPSYEVMVRLAPGQALSRHLRFERGGGRARVRHGGAAEEKRRKEVEETLLQ